MMIQPSSSNSNASFVTTRRQHVPLSSNTIRNDAVVSSVSPMNDIPTAKDLRLRVETNSIMHQLAAVHFASRQFWFSTIPLAVLTMACSIMSFLSISKLFDETSKIPTQLVTSVAITTALLVLLQTISGEADFAKRATMHEAATINLGNLRQQLEMCKGKIELKEKQRQQQQQQQRNHNHRRSNSSNINTSYNNNGTAANAKDESDACISSSNSNSSNQSDGWDTFESVITMHQQYFNGCKSVLPPEISDAFLSLDSELQFFLCIHEFLNPGDKQIFEKKGYDMLSSEIVDHFWFPLWLPNSKKITRKAMKQLHLDFQNYNPCDDDYDSNGCFGCCGSNNKSSNKRRNNNNNNHQYMSVNNSERQALLVAQGNAAEVE